MCDDSSKHKATAVSLTSMYDDRDGIGLGDFQKQLEAKLKEIHDCAVHNWSEQQLAVWLRDVMKLGDVADAALAEGEIDGAAALEMIRDDWIELGASGVKAAKIVSQLKKLV